MTASAITTPMLVTLAQSESTWSQQLVAWTVLLGIVLIVGGMLMCLYRLVRGPHLADRAIAADTVAVLLIGLVLLLSIRFNTLMFFDGILVLSLLGFAGTVAMAQYIGRPHLQRRNEARRARERSEA